MAQQNSNLTLSNSNSVTSVSPLATKAHQKMISLWALILIRSAQAFFCF
ncbi:hypothetical protein EDB38_12324 [Vibrio crassostreae]|uniref:Uncharacterized protein n=1 Tax=Vibrio splendidus TaxID=29497 RepID=A0A0H3ZTW2_VIBSP|nr:hypothetical protein [Vibrio crassostreae]AKN37006.1 hypothetical protein [Vibrio splendidus]ROO50390.1 hypothetical protein EDB58_112115 [Vibrio crassostreae]TCL18235.1 hypothetical protein EDB52_1264 [Vibrio crassostreae]TCN05014.1 hypothetical protein EDB35_1196 [Vibrio crassostreae]TCN92682.1 hypothetical protein EDB50_11030 [Vibrio crassostreae]